LVRTLRLELCGLRSWRALDPVAVEHELVSGSVKQI
jgi:hypothetical protein